MLVPNPQPDIDTSRISITAHMTGYTWYANGLSSAAFATMPGRLFYHATRPWMRMGGRVLGIADFEATLLQRHRIIDHLLEKAVEEKGVGQVLELACGLSARGVRFMEKYGPEKLRYVEADLPGMAARKKKLLQDAGLLGENHFVVPVNILAGEGELSLEQAASHTLDPNVPTAVITEGITYYFPLEPMKDLWGRIANLLSSGSGGVYLYDDFARSSSPFYTNLLMAWTWLVGIVAQGKMHLHFLSGQEVNDTFCGLGFCDVSVHRPEAFAGVVPIPVSRIASFVDIIEAFVEREIQG